VIRETESDLPQIGGGLAALGSSFGIDVSNLSGSGLSAEAYRDILFSKEVRLGVVRDTFRFPDTNVPMTFVAYQMQNKGFVSQIFDRLGSLTEETDTAETTSTFGVETTPEEEIALEGITDRISSFIDPESNLMTISTSASDPVLAARIADSFLQHLTRRVREIQTKKVRENLSFVEEQFADAEKDLKDAEERLARFLENNQNPTSALLRFKEDRIRRQVRFKEQLYSELQKQFTSAQLNLQRQQPVITVVEQPLPPFKRSAPRRTLIAVLSIFGGLIVGVAATVVHSALLQTYAEKEDRRKLAEVSDAVIPKQIREKVNLFSSKK
jgi:uncharacterized protein involved in exopolysaccharide biosynthesis